LTVSTRRSYSCLGRLNATRFVWDGPLGLAENMSSILFWRHCFSVMLCFFALAGTQPVNLGGTTRQDAEQKASPEMDRLKKLYLGTWDYTETYEKTPFYPQGGSDTGVYTSELGPGGNSIVNRFYSRGAVGDFEGLLVMTWDPKEKAYKSYAFGNEFPGCVVQRGQFEFMRSFVLTSPRKG
jgi:hypothetical protein